MQAIQAIHVSRAFAGEEEEDYLQPGQLLYSFFSLTNVSVFLCLVETLQKPYWLYMHTAQVTLNEQRVLF